MCQLADMDYFKNLSDDDPTLANSPLLRAAQLTLQYTQDNGSIELTKTKAFKRTFVHWAAKHFDWPGMGRLYFEAISVMDLPVIIGSTYILTVLFLISIFIADLLYGYFDPRVRTSS